MTKTLSPMIEFIKFKSTFIIQNLSLKKFVKLPKQLRVYASGSLQLPSTTLLPRKFVQSERHSDWLKVNLTLYWGNSDKKRLSLRR
jgi:hypothetical protein